jgi:hypothetical protein
MAALKKKTTVTFSSNNWFRANCGMQNVMLFLNNGSKLILREHFSMTQLLTHSGLFKVNLEFSFSIPGFFQTWNSNKPGFKKLNIRSEPGFVKLNSRSETN